PGAARPRRRPPHRGRLRPLPHVPGGQAGRRPRHGRLPVAHPDQPAVGQPAQAHRAGAARGPGHRRLPALGRRQVARRLPVALTVVDHPLAGTMLTALRDASTPPPLFRLLTKRLSLVLAVEATRGVPTEARAVTTPLGETERA